MNYKQTFVTGTDLICFLNKIVKVTVTDFFKCTYSLSPGHGRWLSFLQQSKVLQMLYN